MGRKRNGVIGHYQIFGVQTNSTIGVIAHSRTWTLHLSLDIIKLYRKPSETLGIA